DVMDDRVGRGVQHRLADRARVEQVERDRFCAERAHKLPACRRDVRTDNLMTGIDQLWNETAAEGAARTCDEDSHLVLLSSGWACSSALARPREETLSLPSCPGSL